MMKKFILLFSLLAASFQAVHAQNASSTAQAAMSQEKGNVTFSMIKPLAVQEHHIGAIINKIEESGLKVSALRLYRLSVAEAETFYQEHKGKPFYPALVEKMSSGPVVLMVISGPNAVAAVREVIGATDPAKAAEGTVRKLFGKDMTNNAIHASDSDESAKREIGFFFSNDQIY